MYIWALVPYFPYWQSLSVLAWLAGLQKNGAQQMWLVQPSFIAVAAVVEHFALQVSSGVVHARDSPPEPVNAPADPSFTATRRLTLQVKNGEKRIRSWMNNFLWYFCFIGYLKDKRWDTTLVWFVSQLNKCERRYPYLFAFEKALLVTVGDVERESHDPRSVLHGFNEIIQSSPAGPLNT